VKHVIDKLAYQRRFTYTEQYIIVIVVSTRITIDSITHGFLKRVKREIFSSYLKKNFCVFFIFQFA